MPSKYKAKDQKKRYNIQKQDAVLPYKQHYKPPTELEMCPNCGYTRPKYNHTKYSKCFCGGTFQSGRSKGMAIPE